jgi:hypothetical protein
MPRKKEPNRGKIPAEPCAACGKKIADHNWGVVGFSWGGKIVPRVIHLTEECQMAILNKIKEAKR